MKRLLLPLLFSASICFGQTAVSVANGSWLNPTTWNCACVPISGYSVTINHSVTLNTSMAFTTGGITVSNTGSLVQDANRDILISGGYYYNNGYSSFRFLAFSAGTGTNGGTYSLTAFSNSVTYFNNGTFNLDSMYCAATFSNQMQGRLNGNRFTNASDFYNNGRLTFSLSLNTGTFTNNDRHQGYAFTNSNQYTNNDSLVMSYSMWNRVRFNNSTNGLVRLTKNFHNTIVGGTAVFANQGNVQVLDSWYNTDTVKGTITGTFTVADSSANSGIMKGNYKFCDQTLLGTVVDFNTGTITPGITTCAGTGLGEHQRLSGFVLYPNPNNGRFSIRSAINDDLNLLDLYGRSLQIIPLKENEEILVELRDIAPGTYFLKGKTGTVKILIKD